jgi:hypothetical protein
MSDSESPELLNPDHRPSIDDIRALTAAATPHFAQQVRERVKRLIDGLPDGDPVRIEGEAAIESLLKLGRSGEVRGTGNEPTISPLGSVTKED